MKLPKFNGWQRVIVTLTVVWLVFVAGVSASETVFPSFHNWLVVATVNTADPLGLFPQVVWHRVATLLLVPLLSLWLLSFASLWIHRGFARNQPAPLLLPGRLPDVLALIQVLALDQHAHRSECLLAVELQGKPRSAESWQNVAQEHTEFFRVRPEGEHTVSLIARHVLPKNEFGERPLPVEYTGKLLELAVELHDRQLRRAKAWEAFVPILVALIVGVLGLVGIALKP